MITYFKEPGFNSMDLIKEELKIDIQPENYLTTLSKLINKTKEIKI